MAAYPRPSTAEPITYTHVADDGSPISGADVVVRVRRSDGLWYDWADGSYAARAEVSDLDEVMAEIDEPGTYEATWPGGASGRYTAFVAVSGVVVASAEIVVGGLAAPGDEMALGTGAITAATIATGAIDADAVAADAVTAIQSGLATTAELADVQADVDAVLSAVGAAPSADDIRDAVLGASAEGHGAGTIGEAIGRVDVAVSTRSTLTAAQVDTQLSSAHGAGSWATATGFATAEDVSAVPAAVQALILADGVPFQGARIDATISSRSSHAATDVWSAGTRTLTGIGSSGIASQASVSALPTSAAPTAAEVADAVWDEPLAGHATAGSAGWAALTVRKWITNRHEVDSAGDGRMRLWDDDGSTVWLTWALRDGSGDVIALPAGSPARRGAAT